MCSGLMLLVILMEKLLKHFWEKGKTYDKTFKTKKVIKRKGNKLHVTFKGYNNSFRNWIDKEGIE